MISWLLENEGRIRLFSFAGAFLAFAVLEIIFPLRKPAVRLFRHYLTNFSMIAIASVGMRWIFPVLGVGAAAIAAEKEIGLLHQVSLPVWLGVGLTVLLMDCAIYFQHRLFHKLPWLWRLHRVHHSDVDFDVSTGIRFHPFEIFLSMLIKLGVIFALGAQPVGVLLFEILLNLTSLFNHMNLRMPPWLEKPLRWLIVTPDMHRIHHSVHGDEMNSNFAFSLSVWDRIFGTYRAAPRESFVKMAIGVRGVADTSLIGLLIQPFRSSK